MADLERAMRWAEVLQEQFKDLSNAEASARLHVKLMDLVRRGDFKDMTSEETGRRILELIRPGSAALLDKILKRYDDLTLLANTVYKDLGPDVSRNLPKIEAIEEITMKRMGQYSKTMSGKIARTVRLGLSKDWDQDKMARLLQDKTNLSRFVSETIARTQVNGYGNALKQEKARMADCFFEQYIGFLRGNTREFCRMMLNVTLHVNDIHKLDNGQRLQVMVYCGGYNCHHHWEPAPGEPGDPGGLITRQTGPKRFITFWERKS
jgi:hypothetical protein